MRKYEIGLLTLTVLLSTVATIDAHVFGIYFDSQKPISVTGTIVKVDWVRPNTYIHVQVVDKQVGKMVVWAFEAPPPAPLKGVWNLSEEMFKEGTTITIVGWQGKSGANLADAIADTELAARIKSERQACAAQFEFSDGRKVAIVAAVPVL